MNHRQLGFKKEKLAVNYLKSLNYKIIETNWHYSKLGEIDIITIDPNRFNEEYLIFIEVKFRTYNIAESLKALSFEKQKQIKKLALYYLKKNKLKLRTNISFDFIAMSNDELKHLKNIF